MGLHDLFGLLVYFSRLRVKPARVQRIFLFHFGCFCFCVFRFRGKPFSTFGRPQRKSQQVAAWEGISGSRHQAGNWADKPCRAKWANKARAAEGSTGATPSRIRLGMGTVSGPAIRGFILGLLSVSVSIWVLDWVSVLVWFG